MSCWCGHVTLQVGELVQTGLDHDSDQAVREELEVVPGRVPEEVFRR